MRKLARGSLVAAALALVLAGWWVRSHQAALPVDATRAGTSAGAVLGASPSASAAAADRLGETASKRIAANFTLPPQDVPLASVLPALEAAARAGVPQAMCRLSFELSRCGATAGYMREYYAEVADQVLFSDGPASDYAIKEHDKGLAQIAELDRICAGVVAPGDLKPWRLLRDAARAGHVPSMVRFATRFPGEAEGSIHDLEALAARRDESIAFLQRAAAAGEGRAAYDLFWGYKGNAGFPTFHKEDKTLALAYAIALRGAGDADTSKKLTRGEAELRRQLTPAEVQAAERLGGTLAPGLAHLVGAEVNLQWEPIDSAAHCEHSNARTRPIPAIAGGTAP